MMRRILAMLSALLVVSLLLTACDIVIDDTFDNGTGVVTEADTTEAATTAEETEETEGDDKDDEKLPSVGTGSDYDCELPELDYKGANVTILHTKGSGRDGELTVEGDSSSNRISAAVNERNLAVERQLGVKLNVEETYEPYAAEQMLRNEVNSAGDTYQIVMNATYASVNSAISGCYRDLNSVENLDRSKHYWAQDFNEAMTLGMNNRQFLVTGPVAISLLRCTYFTVFNETEFAAHDIDVDTFYQDVKDGKWTIEYQKTLINQNDGAFKDNGDEERDDRDFYGLVTGSVISVDPYTTASGIEIVVKDQNTNALSFNGDVETLLLQLCTAVSDLYRNKSTYYYADYMMDDIGLYSATEMFSDKRAMMATTCFDGMETHAAKLSEIEYGIVPMPKLTEGAEYHTYARNDYSSLGISRFITNKDELSMLGAVMESMAYHSNRNVRSAYYADALGTRVLNDPQSKEMLGLLYDTMTFDFTSTYTGAIQRNIRDELRPLLATNNKVNSIIKQWGITLPSQLNSEINAKMN